MAIGDNALAGNEETNITVRFAPDDNKSRTIWFKGWYLSIYNQQTEHEQTHIDNDEPTTVFKDYEIPAGYTCYVRGASVYFKV
jgi:hypothetical protein